MSVFKYGELTISVEPLETLGDWRDYGIKLDAPGHPTEKFKIWYPEEKDRRLVAQVFLYDLIEAYEDPQRFVKRQDVWSTMPPLLLSPEGTKDFLRVAFELKDFLHQAHVDVYKDWALKPLKSDKTIERGPREWMPYKKKI
jgi:hypothetical protein